jgi:hypothetical protein
VCLLCACLVAAPWVPMSEVKRAKVLEAYESRSADGLSLTPGDTLEVLDSRDGYWWLGRVNGRTGLFPSSRVAVIEEVSPRKAESGSKRVVVGIYAFEATSPDELSFAAGEEIEVVAKSKSGWWKGRIGTREGLFPVNRTSGDESKEAKLVELQREKEELKRKKALIEDERRARDSSEDSRSVQKSPRATVSLDSGGSARGSPLMPSRSATVLAKSPPEGRGEAKSGTEAGPHSAPSNFSKTPDAKKEEPKKEEPLKKEKSVALVVKATEEPKRSPMMPRVPAEDAKKKEALAASKDSLSSSGAFRSPSPRRMLELLKSKITSKKDLDIEHPFEHPQTPPAEAEEKDHFQLLNSDTGAVAAATHQAKEDPVVAQRKRHGFILAELVDTEEDYVKDCEMIVELFLVPLRINKVVSKEEADNVFQNLPHLIPANRDLLDKLRSQMQLPPEQQRVGAVFSAFFNSESIKEYTRYASQSMLSGRTLLALAKTNPQWAKFLDETYRNPALRDLKLDTYLIKPVQRVCRYPLLLGELQRSCVDSSVDKKDLTMAIECLSGVIREINETRRESELLHHVVELENSLRNLPSDFRLVAPGRALVRDAHMERLGKKSQRRRVPILVWMFSDCLVWGRAKGKASEFKGVAMFNAALMHDVPDSAAKEIENAFEVMMFPSKETVVFCCSSRAQKQEWVADLTAAIDRILVGIKSREPSALDSSAARVQVPAVTVPVQPPMPEEVPKQPVTFESMTSGTSPRKKTLTTPLMRATTSKHSVRVKGAELSARVTRLRDEMIKTDGGVEMMESDGERYFCGRVAVEWTMRRFGLGPEKFDAAIELMGGLLHSGVIEPVLETPGDEFLYSFTAYYAFVAT